MASSSSSPTQQSIAPDPIPKPISLFLHSTTSHLLSLLPLPKPQPFVSTSSSKICVPLLYPDNHLLKLAPYRFESSLRDPVSSEPAATMKGPSSSPDSRAAFPSTVRVSGMNSGRSGGGGPAFVGQVFSMCDPAGIGLMAGPSSHSVIPYIPKRASEWLNKMFASINKSEKNKLLRFFMDLGDAAAYVKRTKTRNGLVGVCGLDLAYERFKRKPDLFEFVPNQKQVKAAKKLLKEVPQNDGRRSIEGVPVFSAQNLDIAIATTDGIKWYTPYFFDKGMLDNILEESVDQHFHTLIQTRHIQRRRDVIDENLPPDVIEDMGDSLWEPPEVQEMADETGHPVIPLSVISKAAEIELLHAVDKVLLGNRWLRKATGIQPKFPYMVDSFEKRSAASFLRASESTSYLSNPEMEVGKDHQNHASSELKSNDTGQNPDFRFPFGDWLNNPFVKHQQSVKRETRPSPFLPKVTMVGISTGEAGHMSKSSLKKTMNKLTKELEEIELGNGVGRSRSEERDPLFVANVGDYYSRTPSSRWVRRGRVKQHH